MKTQYGYEFKPKDPVQYDDVLLKRMTCSHIEQQTFIYRDGTKEKYCPACRTFESDMEMKPTKKGGEQHER